MANLKRLTTSCSKHFFSPTRMVFSHWSGPYRATYKCSVPTCKSKKTYQRKRRHGPVTRVG